jgi:uncharacterized membrane protein YdcZ (DUF606 family)
VPLIVWIVLFSLLGGLLSVLAAALFLLVREPLRNQLLPHLVSFATGTLLAAALLGLLPHALAGVASSDVHVILPAGKTGAVAALPRGSLRGARAGRAPSPALDRDHDPDRRQPA